MKVKGAGKGVQADHLSLMKDRIVNVRLFGAVELENKWGSIKENKSKRSQQWALLKYLLANRKRIVTFDELFENLWPASEHRFDDENVMRVRLTRLRSELSPLNLNGKNGLILYSDEKYRLNPTFPLKTDTDDFMDLKRQSEQFAVEDPMGLKLCADALELFRGPFMEYSKDAPWVEEIRSAYFKELSALARNTLARIKALKTDEVLPLLCQRTAAMIPEDSELHNEIISHLKEQKKDLLYTQHIFALTHSGKIGQPNTKDMRVGIDPLTPAAVDAVPPASYTDKQMDAEAENIIHVRLFGIVELKNSVGSVKEYVQQKAYPFFMLKYLLLDPRRKVTIAEFQDNLFAYEGDVACDKEAIHKRRYRLNNALEPLGLAPEEKLICYTEGSYWLNKKYTLKTDADEFLAIKRQVEQLAMDDPEGLKLCAEAFEIYHRPYMEFSWNAPWVKVNRNYFAQELHMLARNALARSEALGSDEILPLLCQRTALILHEDVELHQEIIGFLEDRDPILKKQHISQLGWDQETGMPHAVGEGSASVSAEEVVGEYAPIQVRLFGPMELENKWGTVGKNLTRLELPSLLLKYLFVEPKRIVPFDEIVENIWQDCNSSKDDLNHGRDMLRTQNRLIRLRESLSPIHLNAPGTGLVLHANKTYGLNPNYPLQIDTEQFVDLMKRAKDLAPDDPEGLKLCMEALELYRGPYMANTDSAPWIDEPRAAFAGMFTDLVRDTLARSKILNTGDAISLLCQRARAVLPEDEELQWEIICYLVEKGQKAQLVHHVFELARSGKASWAEHTTQNNG